MPRPTLSILRYLSKQLRGNITQATLNTLVGVLLVGLDLLFVWATKMAIDIATLHGSPTSLGRALALIACIMLARVALSVSMRWIRALLGVKAQNSMRKRIFSRLLGSEWTSMRAYHTGNLTNRMERDVTDVVNFATEVVPSFVTTTVQFVGAFLFLFLMDGTLALIIVCVVPFFIVSRKLYVKKMRKLTHDARESESSIQSIIQETLQHVLVIKTLQRAWRFTHKLSSEQENLHGIILHRTRYSTLSATLLNMGFAVGYFVTFAWGALSLSKGLISYGAMLAFIQLVGQIQGPVRNLSRFIPVFITSFTAAERLMDLEDIKQEELSETQMLKGPLGVRFEDVTFSYERNSRLIFDKFNHVFPPGSVTAIVGETGAGKTTLIRLLLSLLSPLEGKISLTCNNGDTHVMSPALRCNFAYVPQGNSLLSGTVRSNLLLPKPDAGEAELHEALTAAAAEFVFDLPQGLDTPCGESGDGLSEGQAQRVAIARALLSEGRVFIFDEATSSLDPETERVVLQRITSRYNDRTLIFITHRTEVLKYASERILLGEKEP